MQIVPEADEHKFEFDLLDPTKINSGRNRTRATHWKADTEPKS